MVQEDAGVRAVVLDSRRRMPGRGLWLHPDEHCLELARRRSALTRALRTQGQVDTTAVLETVRAVLQDGARPPRPIAGRERPPTPVPTDGTDATDRKRAER